MAQVKQAKMKNESGRNDDEEDLERIRLFLNKWMARIFDGQKKAHDGIRTEANVMARNMKIKANGKFSEKDKRKMMIKLMMGVANILKQGSKANVKAPKRKQKKRAAKAKKPRKNKAQEKKRLMNKRPVKRINAAPPEKKPDETIKPKKTPSSFKLSLEKRIRAKKKRLRFRERLLGEIRCKPLMRSSQESSTSRKTKFPSFEPCLRKQGPKFHFHIMR